MVLILHHQSKVLNTHCGWKCCNQREKQPKSHLVRYVKCDLISFSHFGIEFQWNCFLLDWFLWTLLFFHGSAFQNHIFVDFPYKAGDHQEKKAEKKDTKIDIEIFNDKFFSFDVVHFFWGIGHWNVLRKVNDLIKAGCVLKVWEEEEPDRDLGVVINKDLRKEDELEHDDSF